MTVETLYNIFLQHPSVCTDTRKITSGCIFFALKGDNFNGNRFASEAIAKGAAYAVIDEAEYKSSDKFLLVEDSLAMLQELARFHRRQLTIPVLGITGTNGKTTTKELINSVLSTRYRTHATEGNLNNHIGVPLTILSITGETEIGIVEMGANHQQEIAFLSGIAQPAAGLITNVGKAHLEGFGGFEGVKKGKSELYEFLAGTNGTAFINRENIYLPQLAKERSVKNIIYYGESEACFVRGHLVSNDPYLTLDWECEGVKNRVKSNITGTYNLENILAAITIGKHYGLSNDDINNGISSYYPKNNRSQVTQTTKNLLICDYYNANPSSMSVALENFRTLEGDKKALILGDMFELGEESAAEHQMIIEKAMSVPADIRIFIGRSFKEHSQSAEAAFFENTEEAKKFIDESAIEGATILIKGSRGMRLESLVDLL